MAHHMQSPAAMAFAIVDEMLSDRPAHASEALAARSSREDDDLCRIYRETINIATVAMGQLPGTVWYAIAAPSPDAAELVKRYLAGDEIERCALCAPNFATMLAGTAASIYRELHGPAALAAWRSLRNALIPAAAVAPAPSPAGM